jgi:serine/threonine protein kinase
MMLHLLPKELTERYEPIDILGYGAFAMVVKAKDIKTGEFVAIKHLQTKQGDKQKFFRELNLSTRLRHPHIVRCLDVYCSSETASDMVFEFADGGMLRTYLEEEKPFDFAESLAVTHQIAQGLEYAHLEGVVHRDLKPENILLFLQQVPGKRLYKIADFGVAKIIGPNQKTATSIGSPSYMAPEQFYDSYDITSDIYALGIMFYELLHGSVPFQGSTAEIFKGHLEGTLQYQSALDLDLQRLIHDMTLKIPYARPKAKDVKERIESIAAKSGISLHDFSSTPQAPSAKQEVQPTGTQVFADFEEPASESLKNDQAPLELSTKSTSEILEKSEPIDSTQDSVETQNVSLSDLAEEEDEILFPGYQVGDTQDKVKVESDKSDEAILFSQDEPEQHLPDSQKSKAPTKAPIEEESLFDDFPGVDQSSHQVAIAKSDASTVRVPAIVSEPKNQQESADQFFEGFEDEEHFDRKEIKQVSSVTEHSRKQYGRFQVEIKWSRAVERKTIGLLNLEDGQDLLMVIPGKGLQEIKPGGLKGGMVYEGSYEVLGQPVLGHVCMIRNQTFCVLQRGEFYESDWKFDDKTTSIAISQDLSTVASFSGATVTCRRWGGKLMWTGQFDRTGKGIFLSLSNDGNLIICSLMGEDQAVHFFDDEGESLARFWMDAPIVSAAVHHDRLGVWVIVADSDEVCTLYNVTQHHKRPVCALEKPLHNLKASRDWLAGFDDENRLHLVDLSIGLVMPVEEVTGTPLDICVGKSLNELYVLTTRDQVMRYVTGIEIGLRDSESRVVTKLDQPEKPTLSNRSNESEALFSK